MNMSGSRIEDNTSMYLSFDSTLSTTTFKTLEGSEINMDDCEKDESTIGENTSNMHMESTLQEKMKTHESSVCNVSRYNEFSASKTQKKSLMEDFHPLSSTPHNETKSNIQHALVNSNLLKKSALINNNEEDKENARPHCKTTSELVPKVTKITEQLTTISLCVENFNRTDCHKEEDKENYTCSEENDNLISRNIETESTTKLYTANLCGTDIEISCGNNFKSECVSNSQSKTQFQSTIGVEKIDFKSCEEANVKAVWTKIANVCEKTQKFNNKRKSLLPVTHSDRKYPNLVVKPNINSPNQKFARRSFLPTRTTNRKSIFDKKTTSAAQNCNGLTEKESAPSFESGATKAKGMQSKTRGSSRMSIGLNMELKTTKPGSKKREYICPVCACKFHVKALMDAHKFVHSVDELDEKQPQQPSLPNNITQSENQCKYCDKKFALVRTLHIHLLQNCPKIPPREKRKLEYTEMEHVGKAQLPVIFHTQSKNTNRKSLAPNKNVKDSELSKKKSQLETATGKTIEFDSKNVINRSLMPPPVTGAVKKPAHSGITCTPTKLITCNICDLKFKNVLDYTNHTLSEHFKKIGLQKRAEADTIP